MIMHSWRKAGICGKVVQDDSANIVDAAGEERLSPVLSKCAVTAPARLPGRNRQPAAYRPNEPNWPTGQRVRVLLLNLQSNARKPVMTNANPASMPRTVAWLGYGGLVPFLLLALGSLINQHHAALWNQALCAYGAIILSFVGALHWAMAMTLPELSERQRSAWYAWSVAPALIAWPAMLISPRLAAPLLIAGFIAHYLQDRRLASQAMLPAWYLPLRLRLSAVACVSLVAAAFAYA